MSGVIQAYKERSENDVTMTVGRYSVLGEDHKFCLQQGVHIVKRDK